MIPYSRLSPNSKEVKKEAAYIPYSSAVWSLMYAMVGTRSDVSHAVGVVSKYLANPGNEHWNVVKWIFGYLNGTSKLHLCFGV